MKVNLTPWSPNRAILQNAAYFGKTLVAAVIAFLSVAQMSAQNGCACNDNVVLGLNDTPNGRPTPITVNMILEGANTCSGWWIRLRQNGMWVGIDPYTNEDIDATDDQPRYNEVWVDCRYKNTTVYAEILSPQGSGYQVECWGTVYIEDKKPPRCNIYDVTIECVNDATPESINDAYGTSGDNSEYGFPRCTDNCGTQMMTKTYQDEDNRNACGIGVINRTWTITDMSGNTASLKQKITAIDPTPVQITWPDDVELDCVDADTDPSATGEPDVFDDCNQLAVSSTDETFIQCEDACYKIIRKWRVLDWCKYNEQNGSGLYEHQQVIKVIDTVPPTYELPDTLKLGLSEVDSRGARDCEVRFTPPEPGNLDDNCGDVNYSLVMYTDENGNCEVDADDVLLTPDSRGNYRDLGCGNYIGIYTMRDCCGNAVTQKVCVVIFDDLPPVAVCDDSSILTLTYGRRRASCDRDGDGYAKICVDAIEDGSHDNCTAYEDLDICIGRERDGRYSRDCCIEVDCDDKDTLKVWLRVIDEACPSNCDEPDTSFCWMNVVVEDKNEPVCTFVPADVTVECGDDITEATLGSAEFEDECTLECSSELIGDLYCGGELTRVWTAEDCGGNITTCSQTITVELPDWTFTCPPEDLTIDCDNFENDNPDPSVTGEEPKLTINDTCNQVAVLGPFDSRGPVAGTDNDKLIRKWEILDWCTGEVFVCEQKIVLEGCRSNRPAAMISGVVSTQNGEALEDVEITVNGINVMTNNDGLYALYNMYTNETYEIEARKDGEDAEGLSTLDIIQVRQHILNTSTFTSALDYLAADVNESKSVSTFDILTMRQMILQQRSTWDIDSWRMVPGNANLSVNDPWSTPVTYVLNHISEIDDVNFTAVKIGDVNNSYNASRSTESTIKVNLDDQFIAAGETVTIPFNFNADLLGYQMTVDFKGLEIESIEGADANFNVINGDLATSWDAFSNTDKNFSVTVTATENVNLSEAVFFTSDAITAEAYSRDGAINDIELSFEEDASEFVLYQNTPNPFQGRTTIAFNMPQADAAQVSVYDVTGKVVFSQNVEAVKGYNSLRLDINATGILYYSVQAGEYTATKKMISNK